MKHLPARCLFAALSSFAAWWPAQFHASVPLPPTLSASPNCVLGVSPDAVFPIVPFGCTALPIPASLRSVTVRTQNVTLQANGFAVWGVRRIDAL